MRIKFRPGPTARAFAAESDKSFAGFEPRVKLPRTPRKPKPSSRLTKSGRK